MANAEEMELFGEKQQSNTAKVCMSVRSCTKIIILLAEKDFR